MNPALTVRNLRKRYGKRVALDGLELEVPRGAAFGLVGPNGAGKTTAMMVICGLLRSHGGSVDLLGEGPFKAEIHQGRVALLPQDSHFPPHARVAELLSYYGRLQGLDRRSAQRSAAELLEWVDLKDRAQSAIRTLSHGMVRRVAIAQAFLGEPELVLLDEPTSGLDPRQVVQIRELVISRRGRQTVVISSHNLRELEASCDHVAFVEAGQTIRQDSMDEVTGRSRLINYRLSSGTVPVDHLRQSLPTAAIQLLDSGSRLEVRFGSDGLTPERINAAVLESLLGASCGIREVQLGSDLEREYLNATPEAEERRA